MTNAKTQFHVSSRALEEKIEPIRRNGYTPGNVFGLQKKSETISLNTKALSQHLKTEGETGLLYLVLDEKGSEQPVLFAEVQRHPVTNEVLHVSFLRVNLAEKITQEIDVKLTGTFELKEATVVLVRDVLEVEALPADLPEAFYIDISKLTEVGQEVHVSDLEYDHSKVVLQLSEEEQLEPIALVQEVKEEVIEEPVVEEAAAEGETPAEGAEGEAAAQGGETAAEAGSGKSDEADSK